MGWQVGFDSQGAARGMRQDQAPRMQMQVTGKALHQCGERQVLVRLLIFLVAQDGGFDSDAMNPELMRAALAAALAPARVTMDATIAL